MHGPIDAYDPSASWPRGRPAAGGTDELELAPGELFHVRHAFRVDEEFQKSRRVHGAPGRSFVWSNLVRLANIDELHFGVVDRGGACRTLIVSISALASAKQLLEAFAGAGLQIIIFSHSNTDASHMLSPTRKCNPRVARLWRPIVTRTAAD